MNKYALEKAMKENNVTYMKMYEHLGISKSALYRKVNGKTEFKQKEIKGIIELLHLTSPEGIFFN